MHSPSRPFLKNVALVGAGMLAGAWLQPLLAGDAHAQAPQSAPAPVADAVEYNLYLPPPGPTPEKVVQKLDALGAQGWHLVTTTTSNGGTSAFIFSRPRR